MDKLQLSEWKHACLWMDKQPVYERPFKDGYNDYMMMKMMVMKMI